MSEARFEALLGTLGLGGGFAPTARPTSPRRTARAPRWAPRRAATVRTGLKAWPPGRGRPTGRRRPRPGAARKPKLRRPTARRRRRRRPTTARRPAGAAADAKNGDNPPPSDKPADSKGGAGDAPKEEEANDVYAKIEELETDAIGEWYREMVSSNNENIREEEIDETDPAEVAEQQAAAEAAKLEKMKAKKKAKKDKKKRGKGGKSMDEKGARAATPRTTTTATRARRSSTRRPSAARVPEAAAARDHRVRQVVHRRAGARAVARVPRGGLHAARGALRALGAHRRPRQRVPDRRADAVRRGERAALPPRLDERGQPAHPDRKFELNLCIYEEREMAKVLVALAVAEPGENWKDERYKRDSTKEWIPGWELPKEWETEVPGDSATGVRKFGLLEVTYAGTPVPKARRELMPRFLCGRPREFAPACDDGGDRARPEPATSLGVMEGHARECKYDKSGASAPSPRSTVPSRHASFAPVRPKSAHQRMSETRSSPSYRQSQCA